MNEPTISLPTDIAGDDWISIDIDRKHLARRRRSQWQLCRKGEDGVYRPIADWEGPRRSIYAKLVDHGVTPSREAEFLIDRLSEQPAFRQDAEKRGQMPPRAV